MNNVSIYLSIYLLLLSSLSLLFIHLFIFYVCVCVCQVLDGALLDSPSSGRYCGTSSPRPLVSSGNHLTLHLVTGFGLFVSFR